MLAHTPSPSKTLLAVHHRMELASSSLHLHNNPFELIVNYE